MKTLFEKVWERHEVAAEYPCGTILSVALLLRHSLELHEEAKAIQTAVYRAIAGGARTADIAAPGAQALTTREAADAVVKELKHAS